MEIEHHFIKLGADRLFIEEVGSGPRLLCLPGLGGGAWYFRPLAECLKDRYRLVSIDLPQTGKSTGQEPGGFTLDHCVLVLNAFLKQYPPKSFSLLAHSMSTLIALKLYSINPNSLRSLIFVGGLPKVRDGIRQMLNLRLEEIRDRGMKGMGQKIVAGVFSREFRNREHLALAKFSDTMEALSPNYYAKGLEEILAFDGEHLGEKIDLPCLALTGSEDLYAPPKWVKGFAATLKQPAMYIEIAGCGHMPFLEKPEQMSSEVAKFLDTIKESNEDTQ